MSKIVGILSIVAAVFVLCLGTAVADDDAGAKGAKKGKGKGRFGNPEQLFKKLDTNNDGKLSKDEFMKIADKVKDPDKATKVKNRLEKVWTKVSVDNAITMDQFKKLQEMRKKRKKTADTE